MTVFTVPKNVTVSGQPCIDLERRANETEIGNPVTYQNRILFASEEDEKYLVGSAIFD